MELLILIIFFQEYYLSIFIETKRLRKKRDKYEKINYIFNYLSLDPIKQKLFINI